MVTVIERTVKTVRRNTRKLRRGYSRREALKKFAAASAAAMLPATMKGESLQVAGHEAEIQLTSVSQNTFRLTLFPIQNGKISSILYDGSLVRTDWGTPDVVLRGEIPERVVK